MKGARNHESPAPAARRREKGCEYHLVRGWGWGRNLPDPGNPATLHQCPWALGARPVLR